MAPAPWPEAPVVPGLPVPVEPALPLWPLLVVPIAELPPMSLPLLSITPHAVKDRVIMLLMRRRCIVFMIISL